MLLLKIIWLYESCLFTCTFYIQTNLIVQTIWNSFFVKRCALFLNQRVNIFFYELLIRNGNSLFVLCKPKNSLNCALKMNNQIDINVPFIYVLQKIEPSAIEDFYGLTTDIQKSSETGYILFYQSRDSSSSAQRTKFL